MQNLKLGLTAIFLAWSSLYAPISFAENHTNNTVAVDSGSSTQNRSVEDLVAIAKAGESNEAINEAVLGNEAINEAILGNDAINPNADNANANAVNNSSVEGVNNKSAATAPIRSNITLIDDQVGVLNPQEKLRLEKQLQNIYFEGLANIALIIVPTTNGAPIFDYSLEIAEKEGLGNKDTDDGLLILVAVNDRDMYIQSGYGLEGVLPDSALNRIIREDITPYFKQDDYGSGLLAGLDKIEQRLKTDPDILAQADAQAAERSAQQGSDEMPSPVFLFVMAMVFGSFITSIFGRVFGSILTAGGFFAGSLALGGGFFMTVIMAIFLWLFLISRGGGGKGGSGGGRGGGMVFLPGMGGGGGGFGGGGFGGGGGGFGGGGAGGSW